MVGGAIAIIPARLGSTRFPGKVLKAETGRPLVAHVCEAAQRADSIEHVVVATDAAEVIEALAPLNIQCIYTGEHPNGTSRLAEATRVLELPGDCVVVNVQGDEPEIDPAAIDAAVARLDRPAPVDIATLAVPIAEESVFTDPNCVKVAMSTSGLALYFSRSPIPHDRDGTGELARLRHLGVYVYRAGFLAEYAAMPETALERCERLEQLRALEAGARIGVAVVERAHEGIDTPEQYAAFVRRWSRRSPS